MSWFRLDDQFHSQPKVIAAGNAAIGLYCRLGTYCADKLTDGFVATSIAKSMGTTKEINALLHCPIPDTRSLLTHAEGGYLMRDYLEYNPSREKVLAEREAAKARMSKVRSPRVRANERENLAGSSDSPDPDPLGVTSVDNSSSSREGTMDDVVHSALRLYADRIAAQNAKPQKRIVYARKIIETGAEHLRNLNTLHQARPDATDAELAEALDLGGWTRSLLASPAQPDHPGTCECGGTGWVELDEATRTSAPCPATEWPMATVLPLRATS